MWFEVKLDLSVNVLNPPVQNGLSVCGLWRGSFQGNM